jgi:hypothetical protein
MISTPFKVVRTSTAKQCSFGTPTSLLLCKEYHVYPLFVNTKRVDSSQK